MYIRVLLGVAAIVAGAVWGIVLGFGLTSYGRMRRHRRDDGDDV